MSLANQPTLQAEVEALFGSAGPGRLQTHCDVDKGHGRLEIRTVDVAREVDWLDASRRLPGEMRLPDVACLVRVVSQVGPRSLATDQCSVEIQGAHRPSCLRRRCDFKRRGACAVLLIEPAAGESPRVPSVDKG